MPLANFISLTDPSGPPSPEAPLSETTMTSVLSRCPVSSRKSSSRPMWWSACARNPAYTSAIRANRRLASSESESYGLV
jgi:hypothetical protein